MTDDERKGLDQIEGGLVLLGRAIREGDPSRELEFRVRDLLVDLRCLQKHGRIIIPPAVYGRAAAT